MKKFRYSLVILLLCLSLLLTGCKAIVDAQNATEPPTDAPTEAGAALTGYDMTTPKSPSWFDNAVFVGDSVTLKLSYYCASDTSVLGKAEFFCAGSLGYSNALWNLDAEDAVHPYYKGAVHLTEECAEASGKNNVFIMLGMNDIDLYGVDDTMKSCEELTSRIVKRSPSAKLYFQSVTPMIESAQDESFNNDLVRSFNTKLKAFCDTNGYKYLDIYSAVVDTDGNLPLDYCSDPDNMGLHFTDTACRIWADYLKNNA